MWSSMAQFRVQSLFPYLRPLANQHTVLLFRRRHVRAQEDVPTCNRA